MSADKPFNVFTYNLFEKYIINLSTKSFRYFRSYLSYANLKQEQNFFANCPVEQ